MVLKVLFKDPWCLRNLQGVHEFKTIVILISFTCRFTMLTFVQMNKSAEACAMSKVNGTKLYQYSYHHALLLNMVISHMTNLGETVNLWIEYTSFNAAWEDGKHAWACCRILLYSGCLKGKHWCGCLSWKVKLPFCSSFLLGRMTDRQIMVINTWVFSKHFLENEWACHFKENNW